MYASTAAANEILNTAIAVFDEQEDSLHAKLDQLSVPLYMTDPDGVVTYFNPACVGFAGRQPAVGQDRWCVTWKLYTNDGAFLPHDQCPMAVAIREKRPVRGVMAVAERPDGSRVSFLPYPTPLIGEMGEVLGAINLLVDVSDCERAAVLLVQAHKCRRLAASVGDRRTADTLNLMADEYEEMASALQRGD